MIHYTGLFFEDESENIIKELEKNKLDYIHDKLHCTFKYEPVDSNFYNEIVGKEFEVELIGYGSNTENSGFEILIPDELKKYYLSDNGKPHITSSLSYNATASNTSKLVFKKLEYPTKIKGKFGYWIVNNDNKYLSYEKYK